MRNIVVLLLLLASCTPQKRFQRLIKKHPELIKTLDTKVIVKDTIIRTDTFFVEGAIVEVPFNVDSLTSKYSEIYNDSLVSVKVALSSLKKVKAKIHIKDRLFIKTDTIHFTKEIIVPAKVVENKNWMWAFIVSWIVMAALIILYWKR